MCAACTLRDISASCHVTFHAFASPPCSTGDIETERLRAAPTPGASGEAAGGVLRAHTPGSSLGGATAAKGARGKQSGSETGSLLAPESMLRSDLRGRRRATGGLEGLLAEVGK